MCQHQMAFVLILHSSGPSLKQLQTETESMERQARVKVTESFNLMLQIDWYSERVFGLSVEKC